MYSFVPTLPAAFHARTSTAYEPTMSPSKNALKLSSSATSSPFIERLLPTTPTSSVAMTSILTISPTVYASLSNTADTIGAVGSGISSIVSVYSFVPIFSAASQARTATVYVPTARPSTYAVKLSSSTISSPSINRLLPTTPTSSVAMTSIPMISPTVYASLSNTADTTGAVVSGISSIVSVYSFVPTLPAASQARTSTVYVPTARPSRYALKLSSSATSPPSIKRLLPTTPTSSVAMTSIPTISPTVYASLSNTTDTIGTVVSVSGTTEIMEESDISVPNIVCATTSKVYSPRTVVFSS